MDLMSQHRVKMLQYEDMLREAEKQRLIKQIKASQPSRPSLIQRFRQQMALGWTAAVNRSKERPSELPMEGRPRQRPA
ncbi:MAG: hypothetical protein U9R25_04575 [Chloroflexota bacterium]|nr:hypothetical protein [Chloroflexota bacterium]